MVEMLVVIMGNATNVFIGGGFQLPNTDFLSDAVKDSCFPLCCCLDANTLGSRRAARFQWKRIH